MTLDAIYNAMRANFPHTAEITTKTDKTLVVDFANTDYRLRFFRTSTNDIKVIFISFAPNASNSGVLDFDFIRPDWSIEKLIDWAIYVITKEHAKELATWFAGIPVVASSESESESDRVIAVVSEIDNSVVYAERREVNPDDYDNLEDYLEDYLDAVLS